MAVSYIHQDRNKYSRLHFWCQNSWLHENVHSSNENSLSSDWSKFIRTGSRSSSQLHNAIWYDYRSIWPNSQCELQHLLRSIKLFEKRDYNQHMKSLPPKVRTMVAILCHSWCLPYQWSCNVPSAGTVMTDKKNIYSSKIIWLSMTSNHLWSPDDAI